MSKRTAYLLTVDVTSERAQFSKNVLETIGFDVVLFPCIPHEDKVLSNKYSFQAIYEKIIESGEAYAYAFEDDINMLKPIKLDEIIQYEAISEKFFFLGICDYGEKAKKTNVQINGSFVYKKAGKLRGAHALGISRKGAIELLEISKQSKERYMDVILEQFSKRYPTNIVRYDLESYCFGHRGVIFQDRKRFTSILHPEVSQSFKSQ